MFLFGGPADDQERAFNAFVRSFPGVRRVTAEKLEYLGSLLLDVAFPELFSQIAEKTFNLTAKTRILPSHQALYLIKNCLGPVKVMQLLRSYRAFLFQMFSQGSTKTCVVSCVKLPTPTSGSFWPQAAVPASVGGLGVRSLNALATSAFLAFAHSAFELSVVPTNFDLEAYTNQAITICRQHARANPPEENLRKT